MNSHEMALSNSQSAPETAVVRLAPKQGESQEAIAAALARQGLYPEVFTVLKRSLDARRKPAIMELVVGLEVSEVPVETGNWRNVSEREPVIVVGAGPAGLYCALRLIECGLRPVLLERGKPVRERRRDLVKLIREGQVDRDSNYCFGEGGAGTYSDGKLYTRSKKRGSWRKVLGWFVEHGADPEILVDTHPHIGTNKLPAIVSAMRQRIESCGGKVHFGVRVTGLVRQPSGVVTGVRAVHQSFEGRAVVMATGHGARDVFQWMADEGLPIERKPFALGVRIEHPQSWVDARQYRLGGEQSVASNGLPPAAYSLVARSGEAGVFSFCMCPGGVIAPCATENGEIVTNGWSPSRRNNPWANSGVVTTVEEEDLDALGYSGPLGALEFQRFVEKACHAAAGGGQQAPAQRLGDFMQGRKSTSLPDCSYLAGLTSVNLKEVLPAFVYQRLREGIRAFDRKMPGYIHAEAIVVAPESRTSSPIRMPREKASLEMRDVPGLFPCGEGAGYAGGIVSAAVDGLRVAEAVAASLGVSPS